MTDFSIPPDFDFGQQFDRLTLTRAMALDPERAVLSMETDGPVLLSRLRGSAANAYEQRIELPVDRRLGLRVRGHCSCPIGANCKHVAAALMAFEAFQIRREKNPDAVLPTSGAARGAAASAATPSPAAAAVPWRAGPVGSGSAASSAVSAAALSAVVPPLYAPFSLRPSADGASLDPAPVWLAPPPAAPTELTPALLHWLGELARGTLQVDLADSAGATPSAATQQLVYGLRVDGTGLLLQLHLATLRKGGELGACRRHTSPPADMLRNRPSYLQDADTAVLAALLPLTGLQAPGLLLLRGRGAAAALRAVLATGRAWLLPAGRDVLIAPLGPPATWNETPLAVSLCWFADAAGQWRTQWRDAEQRSLLFVSLPEPHAIDFESGVMRPASSTDLPLADDVADWLTRMPAVPAEALPALVDRLQTLAAARHVAVPLPSAHARQVKDLGALALEPVLRLGTCADVASEALLHDGFGSFGTRRAPARQAAAELRLRYRPPGGPPVDFHFPAGAADTAFVELPDQRSLLRFARDGVAEAEALQRLVGELELRPWSAAAGLALDRLSRLSAGRLQASAMPAALEGKPLVLVPRRREQWPVLLGQHVPRLEAAGWTVESDDDFPFETVVTDDWEIEVADTPGREWFDVGLKVTVDGETVNLVPLLVSLVQSGWLMPTAADAADAGDADAGADAAVSAAATDVLLPWPGESPLRSASRPGAPLRQRLLRLPLARVAPLMDWLRAAFRLGDRDGALRVSRFDLGTLDALARGARVVAPPRFTELIEQLRTLQGAGGLPAVAVSPNVDATLRDYQQAGLAWMDFMRRAGLGGVLADDMGLGKTLQTLALLQGELDAGRLDRPSLVVVPTSLIGNWRAEAARFTPQLEVLVLHGGERSQQFDRIRSAHLVVTSYPLAVRDAAVLAAQEWHFLVLDEAQRIKNSRSQAALACKELRSRHRLCLSGTPLENHLGELWSLIDFVCPGLLGTEAQFREHYRNPIERRQDAAAAERLARRVRPFILRRTKSQVARELPAKTETLLRVELAGGQADLYETVRATMDKKLREAIARQGLARSQIMVLEALLKLRQVCCDPRLLKTGGAGRPAPSAKMELLLDLLPTLVEDGRRVLLFSQFTEMLELIEPELARLKLGYLKLTGESRDREQIVADFQRGEAPLLLISLKAGGVGLNLTAADTVILYDPWWNPAVEQQAVDRAYRIGQDKPVFVYKLLASGTVEDKMLELQARKAGLADLLLSGVASDAALTAQDFDELFQPLVDG